MLDTIEFHRLGLYCVHWKNALFAVWGFFSPLSLNLIEDRMTRDKRLFDKKTAVHQAEPVLIPFFIPLACIATENSLYNEQCAFCKRCSLLRVVLACYIPACDGVTVGVTQMWWWSMYCSCCSSHSSPWCPLLGRSHVVGIGCAYWVPDQMVLWC